MVAFMQQETTITSEVFCETPKEPRMAIENQRRGLLLHDNVRQHIAARTRALLEHFNCDLFDHPPYSPDLAPSHYHLKNWFGSQRFNNNEEAMEGVETRIRSQAADFFAVGTQKLISQEDKCLNSGGDYVHK
jgi:transposase